MHVNQNQTFMHAWDILFWLTCIIEILVPSLYCRSLTSGSTDDCWKDSTPAIYFSAVFEHKDLKIQQTTAMNFCFLLVKPWPRVTDSLLQYIVQGRRPALWQQAFGLPFLKQINSLHILSRGGYRIYLRGGARGRVFNIEWGYKICTLVARNDSWCLLYWSS